MGDAVRAITGDKKMRGSRLVLDEAIGTLGPNEDFEHLLALTNREQSERNRNQPKFVTRQQFRRIQWRHHRLSCGLDIQVITMFT